MANPYAFVAGNPIAFWDPDGRLPADDGGVLTFDEPGIIRDSTVTAGDVLLFVVENLITKKIAAAYTFVKALAEGENVADAAVAAAIELAPIPEAAMAATKKTVRGTKRAAKKAKQAVAKRKKRKQRPETIVRRMSQAEADETVAAGGLVPKPGSNGAKWVSTNKPQNSLDKKGHEKTVTMQVDAGTQAWLESLGVDFQQVAGEAALPKGVLTKSNEKGAFGIGVDVLKEFNEKVQKIEVK